MLIFADHCVHTDAVVALRENGHDVVRAADVGLAHAPDAELFQYAQQSRRVLFTFDKDFGNITRFGIEEAAGVVVVYIERMSRDAMLHRIIKFFRTTRAHILKGKLHILEADGTRIWPKP